MLMVEKILVALTELTEFNISFMAVINVLPIYSQIRNTLDNTSVKNWTSFV